MRVMYTLAQDMRDYGSIRYLVTNNREEYSIQRIHPEAYISVEMDDDCPEQKAYRIYG